MKYSGSSAGTFFNLLNPVKFRSHAAPPIVIRPAADTSFSLLDGRPIIFSETNQKIYQLNEVGAYIWCRLLERDTIEAISNDLRERGINGSDAHQLVRQALQQWLELDLVDIDWEFSTDSALQTRLAQHTISIHSANEHLLNKLRPLFCHASRGAGQGKVLIQILELDGKIFFRVNRSSISRCEADELAPAVKAYLTERIVLQDQSDLALHAASLTKAGKGLLMCGQPGVGKSTLTLHMIQAGFRYAGDDIVIIAPDGEAEGLPFAPTVKPGSWEMISRIRIDLNDAPVHRRPDGILVRYLPVADVHRGPFSANWIIFLNRTREGSTELTPLGQIDSMGRVIDGSFAADRKLSRRAFVALKRMLAGAKSFELTYSDAVEARDVLADLCHVKS